VVISLYLINGDKENSDLMEVHTLTAKNDPGEKLASPTYTSQSLTMQQLDKLTHEELLNIDIFERHSKEFDEDWCSIEELTEDGQIIAARESKDFKTAHGIFYGDLSGKSRDTREDPRLAPYMSYDKDTLKSLGESGSLEALHLYYYTQDLTDAQRAWAVETSVVFGGTGLIHKHLVALAVKRVTNDRQSVFTSDIKTPFIEQLAWAEFAALRGNLSPLKGQITSRWMTETLAKKSKRFRVISLSDEDLAQIYQKALQLMEKFNIEREVRGMPRFDNRMSKTQHALEYNYLTTAKAARILQDDDWGGNFVPMSICSYLFALKDAQFNILMSGKTMKDFTEQP